MFPGESSGVSLDVLTKESWFIKYQSQRKYFSSIVQCYFTQPFIWRCIWMAKEALRAVAS